MSKQRQSVKTLPRARRRPVLRDQRGIKHSREFTPGPDGGSEYKIRGIPTHLWISVRAKARRERVSVRSVLLHQLRSWVRAKPEAA
jgi:hypothetical protein